jgi:predicted TIM-barrel fold metal-dependent hydrolase
MKNSIPIFDSLAHPMPEGTWLHQKYNGKNFFHNSAEGMKESGIRWAIACGMGPDVGGYDESTYAEYSRGADTSSIQFFPVAFFESAFFSTRSTPTLKDYFLRLADLGYVGVKLHPRMAHFNYGNKKLPEIIETANEFGVTPFLCTYIWGSGPCSNSSPEGLMKLLSGIDRASKVILVHGGGVRLLEYMEIARAFPNTLLDLSLTLCKYPGSSLDMDLQYCFSQFDRRIAIGSDGPEFSPSTLRERFEKFSQLITEEKQRNIAYRNLFKFLPRAKCNQNE